jgi:ribosomal protein S26
LPASTFAITRPGPALGFGQRFSDEEVAMCANCGCGIPEDKHGDERNINWSEIVAAAEAKDMSPDQAIQNMQEMAQKQGS